MRKSQKNFSFLYYVIGAVLLLAVGFVIFHDIPMRQVHVEEVID